MSNDTAVETLHTVDDRSKVVAVLSTAAAFGAGMLAIGDIEFVSIAAAAFGIGVRFASVWWGVRAFVDDESVTIGDQSTAGSFHHGAVGVALAAAGAAALAGRYLGGEVVPVAVAATGLAVVGFLGLSVLLPD